MKKLVLIALAFVTLQATAQKRSNDESKKGRFEQFQKLSAEDIATLQTKKMTLDLDLNASQQKAIQELNLEKATAMKAKMEARQAEKENESNERPSQEDRVKMMNERLDQQIAEKAKMKNILNDEQYEKWEKSQERMNRDGERGERGKGNRANRKKQG
ncbi:hypothetical protein APS56_13625 [Pseudalgibacter alginicilyticus]|uniref:DUF4890 domain-containing protein n=1 Tax=Pseudalgibacter alginicilyticus TaxID=1736674 RepID=A0A0P0CNV3_9FLAO|nr:hypothetical protein [Pseudalgibacter alginicilyticus]ALJ06103.1 hypothetical protein APS56_13625 [Pseudalgibacter alginicilyticus]